MHNNTNVPSALSDNARCLDMVQTLNLASQQHPNEPTACSESLQSILYPHNLEMVVIGGLETNPSLSTTSLNQTVSTSNLIHRQKPPSSHPQVPESTLECQPIETSHLARAESPLTGLSADYPRNGPLEPHGSNITLDQVSGFWERFNKAADFEDREFVKVLGGNLDTLLIFAGLFSGVNTAFIIEALRTIQPDQAQKTNDLIRSVILVLQNTTIEHPLHDEPFTASLQHVRCTMVFFASLCCSLSAAFGAVLGKQWLNHYEREGVLKPPAGRGRERQKKYEGRSHWHMEGIIETLPTILQISLFLFLIALVDLIFPVNQAVAYVVMGFSLVPAAFYVITTTIATLHPLSPFQTRLSITIRSVYSAIPQAPRYLWARLKNMLAHPLFDLIKLITSRGDWASKKTPIKQLSVFLILTLLLLMLPLCFIWRLVTLLPWELWSFIVEGTTLPDAILELKCLIFYAERTSSADELTHVIEAIGTLPPDLQVDGRHPVVTSFSETLLKFVIKPTFDTTKACYTSQLTTPDIRRLLNAFHFLYMSWLPLKRSDSHGQILFSYRDWFQRNLWAVFEQEPENASCASLIADILDMISAPDYAESLNSTELHQELVWKRLQCPSLEDPNSLPYISLIKFDTIYQHLSNLAETAVLVERLHSTMWMDDKPDLNYTRSKKRVYFLSHCVGETDGDLRFGSYLWKCCERFLNDRSNPSNHIDFQSSTACTYYLGAIFCLLLRDNHNLWAQQLEKDGFPPLLMRFFHLVGVENLRGRALLCLVSLWHQRKDMNEVETTVTTSSLYLTPESVANVINNLRHVRFVNLAYQRLHQMKRTDVSLGIGHVVEYLETASRLGLLKLAMESVVSNGFKEVWAGYQQEDPQLQLQLQERVDGLTYS